MPLATHTESRKTLPQLENAQPPKGESLSKNVVTFSIR